MKIALILSLLAAPAFAECPSVTDNSTLISSIVERMQSATGDMAARDLAGEMWEIWLDAPDEIAQAMLDEGMAQLRIGDYLMSRSNLDDLITYCPNYAEGYNQRAFALFLQGNYEDALLDLDAAIAIQPVHLGALTGKVLTLLELGRDVEAQVVLREALAINPWLSERALLTQPDGTDI